MFGKTTWIGLLAAVLLIAGCFMNWIIVPAHDIVIRGVAAEGTRYGRPGYFHFLTAFFFLLFLFTPRIWAKRLNLLVGALNLAWAIRNFIVLGRCEAGECPERQVGFYLVLVASAIMLVVALLPDYKPAGAPKPATGEAGGQ